MIDKTKYLYWLNENNPLSWKEIVWREMYSRIGYEFHLIQMIEYNITNILSVEEFEKEEETIFSNDDIERIKEKIAKKYQELSSLTFGKLCKVIKGSKYLESLDVDSLDKIKTYRDYLAHNCFKERLRKNNLSTLDDVDSFIDELNDFEEKTAEMNEYLLKVFENNRIKTIDKVIRPSHS